MIIFLANIAPLLVCLFIMFVAYLVAIKFKFFSLVDMVWAYLFTIVTLIYTGLPAANPSRNQIVFVMVALWSMRLGTHLFIRLKSHYPIEDARYTELRSKWAKNLKFNFFIFYMFQAVTVVLLSTPMLLIALNPNQEFHIIEIVGFIVWLIAIVGETIADQQLRSFKAQQENKGKVCNYGLWNYSRHPNYFFEWLIWVGLAIIAWPAEQGYLAILSPLLMLFFLLKMTGIPYTERQAIQSKGELYREYQRTTSAFVPWFKRP